MKKNQPFLLALAFCFVFLFSGCEKPKNLPSDAKPYTADIEDFRFTYQDKEYGAEYEFYLHSFSENSMYVNAEDVIRGGVIFDDYVEISQAELNKLRDIFLEQEIYKWDGFNQENKEWLNQGDYYINIEYASGGEIYVIGNTEYPVDEKAYRKKCSAVVDYIFSLAGKARPLERKYIPVTAKKEDYTGSITSFIFNSWGGSYEITKDNHVYILRFEDNPFGEAPLPDREAVISQKDIDGLRKIILEQEIYKWDSFDESQDGVTDGDGFLLEITFDNDASIKADGYCRFPIVEGEKIIIGSYWSPDFKERSKPVLEYLDGLTAEDKQ